MKIILPVAICVLAATGISGYTRKDCPNQAFLEKHVCEYGTCKKQAEAAEISQAVDMDTRWDPRNKNTVLVPHDPKTSTHLYNTLGNKNLNTEGIGWKIERKRTRDGEKEVCVTVTSISVKHIWQCDKQGNERGDPFECRDLTPAGKRAGFKCEIYVAPQTGHLFMEENGLTPECDPDVDFTQRALLGLN